MKKHRPDFLSTCYVQKTVLQISLQALMFLRPLVLMVFLHVYMLKATAYIIAPSLTKLFNLSLSNGVVPREWKMGRIVPIPKTDSPSNSTSGYRPISILPVVSKVLERHVKTVIDDYLVENLPISCHQWGFMPHRSSTSALISVIHDWMCVLDSGKKVCVVFFDIRKAFDSVPHVLLLQKLTEIGLDPCILRWIKNYLTDRNNSL